jgi:CrcB protein
MQHLALIFLGSGLGGCLRWWLSSFIAARVGEAFPWGTLAVNVFGSLAIGLYAQMTGPEGRWPIAAAGRVFFMVGICGGFTTFSSFSLQTLQLIQSQAWLSAGLNVLGSTSLCLVAVGLGWHLGTLGSAR